MNYGDILTRSWKVFWKYKILWLFSLLSSLLGYVLSLVFNSNTYDRADFENIGPDFNPYSFYFQRFFDQNGDFILSAFLIAFAVGLLVSLALFLIRTFMHIGLIRGIYRADTERPEKLSFMELVNESPPYLGRLIGLYALALVFIILVFGVFMGFPVVLMNSESAGLAIFILCLICLLIPVMIIGSIVFMQMDIALVIDNLSIKEAIRRGWEVVRQHAGEYLIIILIMLGISIGVSIVMSIPSYIFMGSVINKMMVSGSPESFLLNPYTSPLTMYNLVSGLLYSIIGVFSNSVFVITYIEASARSDSDENNENHDAELEQESL